MSQRGVPAVWLFRFPMPAGIGRGSFRERRAAVLKASRRKLFEDHLGEALIKPGDSVTVLKKVAAGDEWEH